MRTTCGRTARAGDALRAGRRCLGAMAEHLQQQGQHLARIGVVFDDKDVTARCGELRTPSWASAQRESDDAEPAGAIGRRTMNSLPWPGPSLWTLTAAAVQLDELTHQRQTNAQAALRAVQRAAHLREQVENAAQHVRLDADAVVAHAQHRLVSLAARRQADSAAAVGVLGRRC